MGLDKFLVHHDTVILFPNNLPPQIYVGGVFDRSLKNKCALNYANGRVSRVNLENAFYYHRGMVYVNPMVYFLTNGDSEIVRFNVTDPAFAELKYSEQKVVDFLVDASNKKMTVLKADGFLGVIDVSNSLHLRVADENKIEIKPEFQTVTHFTSIKDWRDVLVVTGWDQGNAKNTFILISNVLSVMDSIEVQSSSSTPRLTQTLLFT